MPSYGFLGSMSAVALALLSSTAAAQQVDGPRSSFDGDMLVTSADVITCPYRLAGSVSVNMRVIGFESDPSWAKISAKLRTKATAMGGADAIVLVTLGHPHITLTSPRSIPITGRAIRYIDRTCAPTH